MAFPATYNFRYYNGDTFEFLVYPKDSQGGVFDNLSSYNARFVISEARGESPTLDSLVLDPISGLPKLKAEIFAEAGYIACEIVAEAGSELINQTYVYDVEISNSDESPKVYTLLTGTISVLEDVAG